MSLPESVFEFLREEIEAARIERNLIVGEILEAQDHNTKISGWRKQRDRCDARIARLSKFLAEDRP